MLLFVRFTERLDSLRTYLRWLTEDCCYEIPGDVSQIAMRPPSSWNNHERLLLLSQAISTFTPSLVLRIMNQRHTEREFFSTPGPIGETLLHIVAQCWGRAMWYEGPTTKSAMQDILREAIHAGANVCSLHNFGSQEWTPFDAFIAALGYRPLYVDPLGTQFVT